MLKLPQFEISPEYGSVRAYLVCSTDDGSSGRAASLMSAAEWTRAISRVLLPGNVAITLCGDAAAHPEFYEIANGIDESLPLALETFLDFDAASFIERIRPGRFRQSSSDGGIKALLDPAKPEEFQNKVERAARLFDAGFDIVVCMTLRPDVAGLEAEVAALCAKRGIEFRPREFSGVFEGVRYGSFKWEGCIDGWPLKKVLCRAWEILIAPDGDVYRCRHDLANAVDPVAHILSPYFSGGRKFIPCDHFGRCKPDDVAPEPAAFNSLRKNSVEIIFEADPAKENPSSLDDAAVES